MASDGRLPLPVLILRIVGGVLYQYGTAAHLALLTAAPLFLYAWGGRSFHAMALFALSLLGLMWIVMNPSPRMGEWPRDARNRISWELLRDPFVFFSVIAIILSGICAINGGLVVEYVAASGSWQMTGPAVSLMPGSVTGCGVVPLLGLLALVVVVMGVRHALGGRARFGFLLLTGVLSAAFVVCWRIFPAHGDETVSLGTLLGVYFLVSIAAWVESWSFDSALLELISSISVSLILAGLFYSASTFVLFAFLPLGLLLFSAGVALAVRRRPYTAWFRTAVSLAVVLLPVGALALGLLGRDPLWPIFTEGFLATRSAAVSAALEAWRQSSQLGVGVGAYPLALGFFAKPEDWQVLPLTLAVVPCGWIQFLFERGIFGALVFLAGFGILLRDLILRYLRSGLVWAGDVLHFFGLLVTIGVMAVLFADGTFAQFGALIPVGAALALSAAAFPNSEEVENGR